MQFKGGKKWFEDGRPSALVLDAGHAASVAAIRSLGAAGWRVVAADSRPRSAGFGSRYVDAHQLVPSARTHQREMAQAVAAVVRDDVIDVVVPTTECSIMALSRWRRLLPRACALAAPDEASFAFVREAPVFGDAGAGVELLVLLRLGHPIVAFQYRRVHEVLSVSEPIDCELMGHATALLGASQWTGMALVKSGGISAAMTDAVGLAMRSGVNLPLMLAELCRFGEVKTNVPADYTVGIESRNWELELRGAARAVHQWRRPSNGHGNGRAGARDVVSTLAGLFDPRNDFDMQMRDDPKPGIADAARAVRAVASNAARTLLPNSREIAISQPRPARPSCLGLWPRQRVLRTGGPCLEKVLEGVTTGEHCHDGPVVTPSASNSRK